MGANRRIRLHDRSRTCENVERHRLVIPIKQRSCPDPCDASVGIRAAFRGAEAAHFVFPWGSPWPSDPTRPVTGVKHAWETLRAKASVSCLLHDLRHTFATRLAEAGTPESTMLALMGHMSRAMLERYSHIRMAAKRNAVAGIRLHQEINQERKDSEVVPVKVPVVPPTASIQ